MIATQLTSVITSQKIESPEKRMGTRPFNILNQINNDNYNFITSVD